MVKTRTTSKLARLHKSWFNDMISGKNYSFGRKDITLVSVTRTPDSMGDLETITESNSTISGDLQFVTKEDKQLLEVGWVKVGDAVFFTSSANTITENSEIIVDSVRWKLTRKVEGPEVDGSECHQAWTCSRVQV